MADIRRSNAQIAVQGVPDNWTDEDKRAFLTSLEGLGTPFTGSYQEAVTALRSQSQGISMKESIEVGAPSTDPVGVMGAVTRGLGPYAAGAALGAAAGAPIGGVGAIPGAAAGIAATGLAEVVTPALTNIANSVLGTSYPTPREAWSALFSRLGVAEPDSAAEQIIEQAAGDMGMALSTVGAGQALQAGAAPLQQTMGRGVGQVLAAEPGRQVAGAAGGAVGAGLARQAAESRELGPVASGALQLAGAIGGDALASRVPFMPGSRAQQVAQRRMQAANITPEDARRTIAAGEREGVPVFRSDIMPPDTAGAQGMQSFREGVLGGMGGPRAAQQRARNQAVVNVLSEFDVVPGQRSSMITEELAQGFIEPRRNAINRYSTQKREALATVPEGEPIDVSDTVEYLTQQIDDLTRRGSYNADVNIPQTPGASAVVDAQQTNVFQPLIQHLSRYRAAFQNKDINDLEALRRQFGEFFVPQEGMARVSRPNQGIENEVYRRIRNDIGEAVRRSGGEEAYERWADANRNLSNIQSDLNNDALRSLVRSVDERGTMAIEANPEVIRRLVSSKDAEVVREVFERLDTTGRNRATAAVMQDIMESATPDIRNVSPNRFANELYDNMERRGVVMTPDQQQRLDGLEVLLDRTRRAETAVNARPQDPGQAVSAIPGARYSLARSISQNPLIGAAAGVGSLGILGAVARRYDSPRVRDMLLDLATSANRPARADEIAKELIRVVMAPEIENQQPAGLVR